MEPSGRHRRNDLQRPPDDKDTWAGTVLHIVEIATESWKKFIMVSILLFGPGDRRRGLGLAAEELMSLGSRHWLKSADVAPPKAAPAIGP